jgi:hypothetical protein|tara:strand:+ start:160 stop:324 length:165 start_codon:yes stop_codon:yes gene_type:complete
MVSYYETNFALINHHGWSLKEVENMIPWERDVYTTLLVNHLREEKERMEKQNRS